ncbi:hypothetical protein SB6408_03491 [Klebsiella spallanzanii]|uniref:Uncharacterized protein n=1 Tax=Klebsiella spallanzanii TaxID=2587528 RepID=A0A564I4T2_9ENTR|nr:hypothetical protein SB6408_03491 [Klebsiella spallanzanii]
MYIIRLSFFYGLNHKITYAIICVDNISMNKIFMMNVMLRAV